MKLTQTLFCASFLLLCQSSIADPSLNTNSPEIAVTNASGCSLNQLGQLYQNNDPRTIYSFTNPDGKNGWDPVLTGINIPLGQTVDVPTTIIPSTSPSTNAPVLLLNDVPNPTGLLADYVLEPTTIALIGWPNHNPPFLDTIFNQTVPSYCYQ